MEERKRSSEKRQLIWNGNRGRWPFSKHAFRSLVGGFTRDGSGKSHGDINNGCNLKCIGAGRALLLTCQLKSQSGMSELHGTEKTKMRRI